VLVSAEPKGAVLNVGGLSLHDGPGCSAIVHEGIFESGHVADSEPRQSVEWDAEKVRLTAADAGEKPMFEVPWDHVTGIWVQLSKRSDRNYHVSLRLQITLETSHPSCSLNFAHAVVMMDGAGGEFLNFLQTSQAGRLKDDRAPSFATSSCACGLYRSGAQSVRSLRLLLGRLSMVFEILYSMCFFTQLHSIVMSKEGKLASALGGLVSELQSVLSDLYDNTPGMGSNFDMFEVGSFLAVGLPFMLYQVLWAFASHSSNWIVLFMLLQHLVMVMMTFDALWRSLRGAWKSLMTFHKAARRLDKAVKKSRTKELESKAPTPAAAADVTTADRREGDAAAQRGEAEGSK